MFEIYFSKDIGRLDHKASEFRKNKVEIRTICEPSFQELAHFLLSREIDENSNSCLVDGFSGSLKDLNDFVSKNNLSDQNILILIKPGKNNKSPKDLKEFKIFPVIELPTLNEITKRGFLNDVIELHDVNLDSQVSNFVKEYITPDALVINEFIRRLMLFEGNEITEEWILKLIDLPFLDANFFHFWDLFLEESNEWLVFFKNHVFGVDSLRKCYHTITEKALEFKNFVDYKYSEEGKTDVEKDLKIKKYTMYGIEKVLRRYGSDFPRWINEFVINLCFFQQHLNYSYSSSISLFRWFLLKQRLKLRPW